MKRIKIIIAFAVIYVFLSVVVFVTLFGIWLNTFWANGYERPIGRVYIDVQNPDNAEKKTVSAQVILYNGDTAFTNLLTRDIPQNTAGRETIIDVPLDSKNPVLDLDYYNVELTSFFQSFGYTRLYKFQGARNGTGTKYQQKSDLALSLFELNQSLFRFAFVGAKVETLSVPDSQNIAQYDIICSPEGLSLQKTK